MKKMIVMMMIGSFCYAGDFVQNNHPVLVPQQGVLIAIVAHAALGNNLPHVEELGKRKMDFPPQTARDKHHKTVARNQKFPQQKIRILNQPRPRF